MNKAELLADILITYQVATEGSELVPTTNNINLFNISPSLVLMAPEELSDNRSDIVGDIQAFMDGPDSFEMELPINREKDDDRLERRPDESPERTLEQATTRESREGEERSPAEKEGRAREEIKGSGPTGSKE